MQPVSLRAASVGFLLIPTGSRLTAIGQNKRLRSKAIFKLLVQPECGGERLYGLLVAVGLRRPATASRLGARSAGDFRHEQ